MHSKYALIKSSDFLCVDPVFCKYHLDHIIEIENFFVHYGGILVFQLEIESFLIYDKIK